MAQSIGLYVVALTQLILACVMTWRWFLLGDGADLLWAVISALLAIVLVIVRYKYRNTPAGPKSDPRVLRRIATVGGATGTIALIALLWRVQGDWIRLGESANLLLALWVIIGLVCAGFGVLYLKEQGDL